MQEYEDRFYERSFAHLEGDGQRICLYPEYKWDPEGFANHVLGVRLWVCQSELCQAVVDHTEVSVRACFASGKTFLAAVLALWWMFTREVCLVISTAPTARQVEELLWAEIAELHQSSKRPLGGQILSRKAKLDGKRKAFGVVGSAKNKSSKAGYHSKSGEVLFLLDEKAGMSQQQIDGFRGLISDPTKGRIFGIGNPVSTSGPFYDEHTEPKGDKFLYAISALRTPAFSEADKSQWPGLVTQAYVERARRELGERHPVYITTILAEFYKDDNGWQVVPETWGDLAAQRWAEHLEPTPHNYLAADVAADGSNETVLYHRSGRRIQIVDRWTGAQLAEPDEHGQRGTMATARRIVDHAERLQVSRLLVDSQGLGIGICDRIREFQEGGRLQGCWFYPVATGDGFGPDSPNKAKFYRIVDQCYWHMREAFDPENPLAVAIDPEDTDLRRQLSWRKWQIIGQGEDGYMIKVSRKRDLIAEGKPSPDLADSVSLLFFDPPGFEGEVFFV
jgi:hypothetical protein